MQYEFKISEHFGQMQHIFKLTDLFSENLHFIHSIHHYSFHFLFHSSHVYISYALYTLNDKYILKYDDSRS